MTTRYLGKENWVSDIRHFNILIGLLFLPLSIEALGTGVLVERVGGGIPKVLSLSPLLFLIYVIFYRAVVFRLSYLSADKWRGNADRDALVWIVGVFFLHLAMAQVASLYTIGGGTGVFVEALSFFAYFGIFLFLRGTVVSGRDIHGFGLIFLISLLLLAAINFLLVAKGQEVGQAVSDFGADDASNKTLGLIGVVFRRVQFPWISGGLNGFAVLCVVLYAIGLPAVVHSKLDKKWLRSLGMMAVIFSVVGLVMIDSRGGILAVIVMSAVVPFFVKREKVGGLLPFGIVAIQLFPLFLILVAPLLEGTPFMKLLGRGVYTDPAAEITTGRSYIWLAIWDEVVERPLGFLFGFGSMGHVVSGISAKYAFVFGGGGATIHSTHNALLQTLVDKGLVGVAFFVTLLVMITKRLLPMVRSTAAQGSAGSWLVLGLLNTVVGLCILAQTEAIMTSYFPLSLYFLAVCASIAMPLHQPTTNSRV